MFVVKNGGRMKEEQVRDVSDSPQTNTNATQQKSLNNVPQ